MQKAASNVILSKSCSFIIILGALALMFCNSINTLIAVAVVSLFISLLYAPLPKFRIYLPKTILDGVFIFIVIFAAVVRLIFANTNYSITIAIDTMLGLSFAQMLLLIVLVLFGVLCEYILITSILYKNSTANETNPLFFSNNIYVPIAIIFASAVISITLFSKSSPFYPLNDWGDANCYMIIAKTMKSGKILYRDIGDQKGPILFFIHYLALYISDSSFLGVWIIEIIAAFFFGLFSYKTARSLNNQKNNVLLIAVFMMLIYSEKAFAHGDSAEELCLPVLAVLLYLFTLYIQGKKLSPIAFLSVGLCASYIFWIKYTITGLLLGISIALLFYSIKHKRIHEYLKGILFAFIGFGSSSLILLIYFIKNNALYDLLYIYFYQNIFLYNAANVTKLYQIAVNLVTIVSHDYLMLAFLLLPLFYCFRTKRYLLFTYYFIIVAFTATPIILFHCYVYYPFIFNVFLPWTIVFVKSDMNIKPLRFHILLILIIAFCFTNSTNTYMIFESRSSQPQYYFSEIINSDENPSLLFASKLDNGFYLVSGQIPPVSYIEGNIKLARVIQEKEDIINNKKVKYIITRDDKILSSNYSLINVQTKYFEGRDCIYRLYKLTESE